MPSATTITASSATRPTTATSAANPTPTLVTLPGGSGTVTQVAAGDDVSLVVTSTGELFAFGANDYGQLGFGTNNGTNNADPSPTQVQLPGGSGTVTGVAAGDDFSLVATSSGELYAFGDNYYGQLGTATNDGVNIANPTPDFGDVAGGERDRHSDRRGQRLQSGRHLERAALLVRHQRLQASSVSRPTTG